MLFIEETTPPPFWQAQLTDKQRLMYDKAYIGQRSQAYYLKRFAEFDKAGKLSAKWHWAGFLMTFPWLLYRKRFLDSIVYSVAGWSFIHVNMTLALVISEYLFVSRLDDILQMPVRFAIAGAVWLFWAIMVARWTDAYYYRMARREIADAIEMYPNDEERQIAHLQQHGGVSLLGMGLAFGFFIFVLFVINVQFLPIYAKKQTNEILFDTYNIVNNAKHRVDVIYKTTGKCPINTPLGSANTNVSLTILTSAEGIPKESDCMVQATISGIHFPNRWINGQKMTMYRLPDATWGCITSFNKKQVPKQCLLAER